MVQSVELLLDAELDVSVREEWELLVEAGLPSQGRHSGPSNAPHVTLGVADAIDATADRALELVDLPPDIRLGGLLVFPGTTSVLARAVVPSVRLLELHATVDDALADSPGRPEATRPGRWTPHVTLARRLDVAELAAALDVLRDRPRERTGGVGGLRRWDSDARRTWDVVRVGRG